MVMNWTRSYAGVKNVVLGFQPTTDYAATVAVPRKTVAEAPKLSWLDRVDRYFWRLEQKRRDEYLARATDLIDLEQRMRDLERRSHFIVG